MNRAKIAITLDRRTLEEIDHLVEKLQYPNRSQAIQEAVDEKLARLSRSLLARECDKLDPAHEKALSEEGITEEFDQWPEY